MRNSTKMGGSIKKKYQVGGLKKMNPAKISVPGSSKKLTPAQQKKYFDKLRKETEKQLRNSPMFPTPKKRKGGVIVASPIQGRTGRRGAAGSNMAKGGQKFPDLTGDGKVTKKDILRGRGVLKHGGAHPGFKAVQSKIAAKQGVSKKAAGAILAASTRKASAKAKAANPRLKRVKG
jgi:hypothetical protein